MFYLTKVKVENLLEMSERLSPTYLRKFSKFLLENNVYLLVWLLYGD